MGCPSDERTEGRATGTGHRNRDCEQVNKTIHSVTRLLQYTTLHIT